MTSFFLECPSFAKNDKNPNVSQCYLELMRKMWSYGIKAKQKRVQHVVPNDLVQAVKYINPAFRGYTQQDSQEFLLFLMERLNEELKRVRYDTQMKTSACSKAIMSNDIQMNNQSDSDSYETCDSATPTSSSDINSAETQSLFSNAKSDINMLLSDDSGVNLKSIKLKSNSQTTTVSTIDENECKEASESASSNNTASSPPAVEIKRTKTFTSIISDTFDGKMISQVQCLQCESISNTIETFQDLSLPIPTREYLQVNNILNFFRFT